MKVEVLNQKAKKVEDIELSDAIFDVKVSDKVLSQYTYSYLSNQRQSNANTKDRSEVSGGGRKPFRQKGTGRARAGSNRSPIWKGGGVVFGPTNDRNWKKKMTKNFKKAAIRNAFSLVVDNKKLVVVDKLELKSETLTKQAVELMANFDAGKKITIVTATKNDNLIKSFANLGKSKVVLVSELNAYDLLTGGKILLEKESLEYINSKWS